MHRDLHPDQLVGVGAWAQSSPADGVDSAGDDWEEVRLWLGLVVVVVEVGNTEKTRKSEAGTMKDAI